MNTVYNKRGFTLIELLVVVLIIGILASVALPQYEKAVNKSRAATHIASLKPLLQAATVCYLENGEFCDPSDWDVEAPNCKPLAEFDLCDYGSSNVAAHADFYSFESTRSPDMSLVLTKDGRRVCCGRASSTHCPKYGFTYETDGDESLGCLGTPYVAKQSDVRREERR